MCNSKSTGEENKKLKELAPGEEFLSSPIFWPRFQGSLNLEAVKQRKKNSRKILSLGLEGWGRS